ncbi:unnamed protein product [Blepharisma stoltei]|uniref:Uncharacterized protein n=1 Tax=Blepharisma stoltei TaxID=1481888 RepID=A0AAU9ICY6_9CILI|nr:unnamed protein product [Blepharisma stoltei]
MDKHEVRRIIKLIPIIPLEEPRSPTKSFMDILDFETKSSLNEDDSPTTVAYLTQASQPMRSNSLKPRNLRVSSRSNANSPIKPTLYNQTGCFPSQNASFNDINQLSDYYDGKAYFPVQSPIRRKLVFPSLYKNEGSVSPKRDTPQFYKRSSTLPMSLSNDVEPSSDIDLLSENIYHLAKEHENLRRKLKNQEILIKKLQETGPNKAQAPEEPQPSRQVPKFDPSTPVSTDRNYGESSPFQVTFKPEIRWSELKKPKRRFPREIFCNTKKNRLSI